MPTRLSMPSEATRAYVYRFAAALFVVLALYKVVDGSVVDSWLDLIKIALGLGTTGLAVANTSTK